MSGSAEDAQARRQRLNDELANVAKHINQVGPRINEVARRSEQYKESVRYRYRKFFLKKGVTIQATPNYQRLGFTRLVVFAKLAPEFERWADVIFTALSEGCYLRSFTRTILEREYIIHVAAPKQLKEECSAFFMILHQRGLFTKCKVLEFEELRNPPMKAEFYNFPDETWKFQWPKSEYATPTMAYRTFEKVEKYDRLDLLILKELEIDANRSLIQISKRVKVPVRTLQFHYLDHIKGRNLVRAYNVSWQGSRYDFERGIPLTKNDRYVEVTVLLEGGTRLENAELRALLNRTPFLWSEAVGPNYCAEVFVPNELYIGLLEYLEPFAAKVDDKLRVLVMHQGRALRFTISYKLFDGINRSWKLDYDAINSMLDNLMLSPKLPHAKRTIEPKVASTIR